MASGNAIDDQRLVRWGGLNDVSRVEATAASSSAGIAEENALDPGSGSGSDFDPNDVVPVNVGTSSTGQKPGSIPFVDDSDDDDW